MINKIGVFNIKRFAVHDGPGIRTTVFIKGCSLHCPWCQNPEGISVNKNILYKKNDCIGCHTCVEECPHDAVSVIEGTGLVRLERTRCNLCGICIERCPTGALSFDSKEMNASEVVSEVLKDRIFFDVSDGGVTLSGGEPLLKERVVYEFLKMLKIHDIHIAVESSLMVSEGTLEKLTPMIDLFIIDFKMIDPLKSREIKGMDIKMFLRNLELLYSVDVEIRCRIPLIPGYTTDYGNLKSIGKLIRELNQRFNKQTDIELINFNPLCKEKYLQLGLPLPGVDRWEKYSEDEIQEIQKIIIDE